MSIELVVEVLDHYHGPHSRKLWLIAWAEKVPKGSRTGYCKRTRLAARLGVSVSRASQIARELEDEGTIKRLGGGVWGKTTEFELVHLAPATGPAQGKPRADPTEGEPRADPTQGETRADPTEPGRAHAQGEPRAHAQSEPRANPNPHNPDKPSPARARGPAELIRAVYPSATDDEMDTIIKTRMDHGARSVGAVLAHEVREGTLRLPCDRDGPGLHSNACRDGDSLGCAYHDTDDPDENWCTCRCHTQPVVKP